MMQGSRRVVGPGKPEMPGLGVVGDQNGMAVLREGWQRRFLRDSVHGYRVCVFEEGFLTVFRSSSPSLPSFTLDLGLIPRSRSRHRLGCLDCWLP